MSQATASPDFALVREQFPALKEKTYLDSACISLAPRVAVEAVQNFLDMALWCPSPSATDHHIAMDDLRPETRRQVAQLLNAGENEIALVESTTHGLKIAAECIPLERGDHVLLSDMEFMQVAVPWVQKRRELGLEIDVIPNRKGTFSPDDVARCINRRTRVLALSSVQWSHGFRCDLKAISDICRRRNVWLVVDAIQQLGAVPIDVQQTPVDILVCGGHKWLMAPFGLGFLYVSRAMRPGIAGYLSVRTPEGGWGNYFQTPSTHPVVDYKFVPEARRYEIGGTCNYPGTVGLGASLKLIHDLGQENIAAHIFHLTEHLIDGLQKLNIEVITPLAPEQRAGIVTFSVGTPQANVGVMEHLLKNKVLVSVRYTSHVGGVRVSCHLFNSLEDVDRLLGVLASIG